MYQLEIQNIEGTNQVYHYVNNIPLNASNPDLLVNFLEYWEFKDEKQVYHITKITDIELYKDNVYQIMRGGCAGFQIENETFNRLPNQGYNLEHNMDTANNTYLPYLSTVLAMLRRKQFLIDQIQEVACPLFKAARNRFHSRRQFWDFVRSRFLEHLLPSWFVIWKSIIYGFKPDIIQLNTYKN